MIGIDVSPSMLEQGRSAVAESGADVELREGDMRELSLEEPAALDLHPVPLAPAHPDVGATGGGCSSASPPR